MRVKQIDITNFRNYSAASVQFGGGINVLWGENAQGKTNLLEAVYLCSVGRSPRTPRDKELILANQTRARVKVVVVSDGGEDEVEIVLDKTQNKSVSINGMPISKIGELMGVVTAVFFSPDEMKIVKEAPGDRRRFLDIALCQMSKAYFYLLNRYNKILAQRNKLLKSGQAVDDTLDVWDSQLSAEGSKIVKTRREYIKRLERYAAENHSYLTDGKEQLRLCYEGLDGSDFDEIQTHFLQELKAARPREKILGYTTLGPQKDDLKVTINGTDARSYGSQGQQRTAALSLKLSEMDLHFTEKGERPILLLDDVLSELDVGRQSRLLSKIANYQTILTCTHMPEELKDKIGEYSSYKIIKGKVF